jgi:predicted acetyltransferase
MQAISLSTRDKVDPSSDNSAAKVDLVTATPDDEPVLANLLELYIHEFTEWIDLDVGPDGRFGYAHLPLYWIEVDRYPFLLELNGKLAGFVLVQCQRSVSSDEDVWDVAEFFILRRYRRRGIGTQAAHRVWGRFPGRWQIRVMEENRPARRFWTNAIAGFCGQAVSPVRVEKDGQWWRVFTFYS